MFKEDVKKMLFKLESRFILASNDYKFWANDNLEYDISSMYFKTFYLL